MERSRLGVIIALGSTQTLAWASSYYLPAILADSIAVDLGISSAWVFAAFSASLLISAFLGPRIGRTIDAVGGRGILAVSNIVIAAGLTLLAITHSQVMLWTAWMVLGVGMALGLYDTAFAALSRIYGASARSAITGITLLAGFASTIGWPLTSWGLAEFGWRPTCLGWAAAHILIGLPINYFFLPTAHRSAEHATPGKPAIAFDRNMALLAAAFAMSWTVTGAMAAHLPRLLEAAGATTVQAIAAGALIGPAQVAARVMEAGFLSRYHPLLSARLAAITHPVGAAVLGFSSGGGLAASAFTLLHGAGNGVLTIARGTVPLSIFGPANYGYRLGLLAAPARVAQALAPLLFGLMVERWGAATLIVSSSLSLAAFIALSSVRQTPAGQSAHAVDPKT